MGGVGSAALVAVALTLGALWLGVRDTGRWVRHPHHAAIVARESMRLSSELDLAYRETRRVGTSPEAGVQSAVAAKSVDPAFGIGM